jgi:hypothetical protein
MPQQQKAHTKSEIGLRMDGQLEHSTNAAWREMVHTKWRRNAVTHSTEL